MKLRSLLKKMDSLGYPSNPLKPSNPPNPRSPSNPSSPPSPSHPPNPCFKDSRLDQNIYRLVHFLAQFFFNTSETEVHYYYYQRVNKRAVLQVADLSSDLRKLGNF